MNENMSENMKIENVNRNISENISENSEPGPIWHVQFECLVTGPNVPSRGGIVG